MPKEIKKAKIGMILGSGLGVFVEKLKNVSTLVYSKIKGWYNSPGTSIKGHANKFVLGTFKGKWLLIM